MPVAARGDRDHEQGTHVPSVTHLGCRILRQVFRWQRRCGMRQSARRVRHLHLRDSLSPELAEATSRRIEHVLGPDLADDLENVATIARAVGSHVRQAAPAVLKGAATGFLAGGPAGAVAGGIAGGLGGVAAQPAPMQPIANPAALQLLLTVLRPEVVEALIAMVLGSHGARGVEIAGRAVPVAAVSNLIQALAEAASATHHAAGSRTGTPRYLSAARERGEDITAPEVRTRALLELVHEAWDDDLDEEGDD